MPRRLRHALVLAASGCLLAAGPALGADPDGDSIPTKWEQGKGNGIPNLKKYGAKPSHKDVFVELDFAQGVDRSEVSCDELDKVYDAFKDAPVLNLIVNNSWPADENIDWECESLFPPPQIDPGTVATDINGDGDATDVFAEAPAEWPLLDYSAGGRIGPS